MSNMLNMPDLCYQKLKDFYAFRKDAPFFQQEFGFYCLDRWIMEGHLKPYSEVADYGLYLRGIFGFDEPASHYTLALGGCEAPFHPNFETKILEDRGEYELVQDSVGRSVLYFKNRRSGFMPEYISHPVKDVETWEQNCRWRMQPDSGRLAEIDAMAVSAAAESAKGKIIIQYAVGAYMYLRSLIGPLDLLYKFYDDPQLIHECMTSWLEIADFVTARMQEKVDYDCILFDEDICYNHGSLISPDMIQEFLMPYYRRLVGNVRSRQTDMDRKLHIHVATDGNLESVIPIYKEIGMDFMSPFEAASGCDVVELGRKYPDLLISGGIDKRILATDRHGIDKMVDTIFPIMKKRGGYIPTCDHGVPEEVSFENYMHYRKRCLEFA
ncbi:MAG: uroporphyrinogen decarboxylase family protein [Saccharofermentanales bacterium]